MARSADGERGGDARRALVMGLYAAVATGIFYGFGVYSQALKHQFGLTQMQISSINTLPYLLGLVSPIFGPAVRKFGERAVLCLGVCFACGSQAGIYVVSAIHPDAIRHRSPTIILVLFYCVTYLGIQCFTSVAFPIPVKHWPVNRAVTTAAVKSFVGLGGISVSEFYRTLFGRPTRDPGALRCLLLWSGVNLLCATIAIVAMPARLGRLHTSAPAVGNDMVVLAPPAEPKRALHAVVVEIAVLGMLSIVTPLMPDGAAHDAMVALMVGMALLPIALALGVGRKRGALLLDMPGSASVPLAGESAEAPPPPPPVARQQTEALQQFTFVEMVRTPEAWLLWYAGTVLIGAGGFIVTQVSFIIHAAGAESTFRGHAVTSAVTIFSASNLLGRLAFPLLSDALFARRGRARPWMVAAIQLTMATAQLLFLLLASPACAHRSGAQSALILLASALGGLSFGAIWPHLVILASEIFGSTHLTTNYLFLDGGGGAIGNVVLGALVPSIIYQRALNRAMPTAGGLFDAAGAAGGGGADSKTCVGPACFAPTHVIIASLCAIGVLASAALAVRTTPLYRAMAKGAGAGGTARH